MCFTYKKPKLPVISLKDIQELKRPNKTQLMTTKFYFTLYLPGN